MTVDRAAAVGRRGALCVPSLDDALIAVALGNAGHVDVIASSKGVDLDLGADLELSSIVKLEFLQVLSGRDASLLEMTQLRLAELLLGDLAVSQLHGNIAVILDRLLLSDDARACFDDRNRDHMAVLIEDLGHAHFLADDCFLHVVYSFLGYWLEDLTIGQPLVCQHDPGPPRAVGARCIPERDYSFISISTPAGRSRPCRASMHFAFGLRISISLLWVLRSNCSRESLYL